MVYYRRHATKLIPAVTQTARLPRLRSAGLRSCSFWTYVFLFDRIHCSNVVGGICCSTGCQLVGFPNISSIDYSSNTHMCQAGTDCTLPVYCIADPAFEGKCPSVYYPYENNYNVANCSWNATYTGTCFLVREPFGICILRFCDWDR